MVLENIIQKLLIYSKIASHQYTTPTFYAPKGTLGAYILNETSKPPVNKTHVFNIAHLLLNCLK